MNEDTKHIIAELEEVTEGRYEIKRRLGRGAYGVVFAAKDKKTKKMVAIKKVEHIFDTLLDAKRCLREVCILSHFNHDNITNLIDVTSPSDYNKFNYLIIIMDLMETDLHRIISSNQPITVEHHRFFIYQILRGLKYIHSANVLHRDLKPANILVNANCDLKITDFGLARVSELNDDSDFLSEYVATRYYRPPEVLLNYNTYGPALDVWSVGCILAEMILRRPLLPGKNTLDQIALIVNLIGSPSEQDLEECPAQNAKKYVQSLGEKKKVAWKTIFRGKLYIDEELDLLDRMLTWDPRKRITVDEALEHPFLNSLHDPTDEPETFPLEEFEFETDKIHLRDLKRRLWEEVIQYHPEFGEAPPVKET
ncbi:CMGC family protein kinase [Trichomonas vaginalis G3]|uniref:Mitogen-activated protein kinase n=1 Tax=Trichomonas vaginalis (strain ATCC PRA-98 / G3) TaxID=412133 RepID=A2FFG0_TRIV3|nr:STKc MAPK domain-containing protein [Trichomonas vaginalis G3]EAX96369.1 CMGC family protein kinase [Trichomonas vaginalis G3]KAI5548996.1 STKc MAPK domain-containing protein [Trichomonas vaginalis G3]|eukprot:XP_001309299.1 CMGC family protein kinase [Trichomonas vaginalis G3]